MISSRGFLEVQTLVWLAQTKVWTPSPLPNGSFEGQKKNLQGIYKNLGGLFQVSRVGLAVVLLPLLENITQ
ncbi:MAG: hypothetical protein DRR19_05265, partial [Candidatus Parabeggiatoa sp. nov. 1]